MLFQTSDETLWFDREEHLRRVSPPPTDCVVHPSTSAHALRARRCPRSQLALSGPKEISWLQKHLEVVRLREEFGLPFPSFSVFCLSLTSMCFSIWQIQTPQLSVCFPEPRGSFSNLQASQTETCFPLFKKKSQPRAFSLTGILFWFILHNMNLFFNDNMMEETQKWLEIRLIWRGFRPFLLCLLLLLPAAGCSQHELECCCWRPEDSVQAIACSSCALCEPDPPSLWLARGLAPVTLVNLVTVANEGFFYFFYLTLQS